MIGRRRGRTRRLSLLTGLVGLVATTACTRAPVDEVTLPIPGGALRVGVREIGSLDPQRAVDAGSLLLARSRYRGLYTLGPDGVTTDALVERFQIDDFGRRYTFTLRADARFSNGVAISAADVVATYNRLAQRGTGSPYASLLDPIDGYEAVRAGDVQTLAGLRADGADRVVVQLSEPFGPLTTNLAHPALGILPLAARAGRFGPASPASGPFMLREYEAGRGAILVRNARTSRATAYLKRVELNIVGDGARSLRAGAVDVAFIATTDRSRLAPRWGLLSLGIDPQRLPNVADRRIIASALDRTDIAQASEEPWFPLDRLVPLDGDPIAGIEPIDQAWKRPGVLRFIHLNDPASRAFAAGIVRSCEARGIEIDAQALAVGGYADALEEGAFDLVQLGWLSEVRSADGFLARQLATGSPDNQLGFSNVAFDRFVARARSAPNAEIRNARYAKAEQLALDEAVLIPVVQLGVGFDTAPGVHGADLDGSGTFDAALAWLEPDA